MACSDVIGANSWCGFGGGFGHRRYSSCNSNTGNDTELYSKAWCSCGRYFLSRPMDVETDSDLYSEVIPRNTRAGGLDNAVIYGRNIVRFIPVLALFTNFSHDDSGVDIQCSGFNLRARVLLSVLVAALVAPSMTIPVFRLNEYWLS